MKILVTGGAGYIGSALVDRLVEDGARVTVLDNLSSGHFEAVNTEAKFIRCELLNVSETAETIWRERPEAIFHFAANTLVGESMDIPTKYLFENTQMFANVIAGACKVNAKSIILSSTANVYGQSNDCKEESIPNPSSPYGEGKLFLEKCLMWIAIKRGIKYAVLRYFNAAGATETRGEDHRPETHLIPNAIKAALGQKDKLIIHGSDYPTRDGTCIRDYVHISDLAEGHILAMEKALQGVCGVYNLGAGAGYSNLDIVRTVEKISGRKLNVAYGCERKGDPPVLIANPKKALSKLGWFPKNSNLETIVQSAYDWHKDHPKGYQ